MADNQHARLLRAFLDDMCEGAERSRAVSWSEWVRRSVSVTAALGLSASLAACSGTTTTADDAGGGGEAGSFGPSSGGQTGIGGSQPGASGGTSSGGTGSGSGVVYGIPLEDCDNGLDDDADGRTDCADDDCVGFAPCSMEDYGAPMDYFERYCDDGVDNDSDGLTDCEDPDCIETGYCGAHPMSGPPALEQNCTDGVDNDEDGATDCADVDCSEHISCMVVRYGIPY